MVNNTGIGLSTKASVNMKLLLSSGRSSRSGWGEVGTFSNFLIHDFFQFNFETAYHLTNAPPPRARGASLCALFDWVDQLRLRVLLVINISAPF